MYDLLNEIEDPAQVLCDKYDIPSWSEYKSGVYLKASEMTPLQHMARSYTYILSIMGDTPRYVVIGKPLIELYVKLGEPIPEKFEEALITYDVTMPFYCAVVV